jgi:hypothetical protein
MPYVKFISFSRRRHNSPIKPVGPFNSSKSASLRGWKIMKATIIEVLEHKIHSFLQQVTFHTLHANVQILLA